MAMNQSLSDLSKEELIEMVQKLKKQKKYGLVWEDQPEHVEQMMKTHLPVLKEREDFKIIKDDSLPHNLMIEGDNLHALNVLKKTHKGAVDAIYIDPPYNTGNRDFVYNDHFVDKEDSWRHSTWLSFMDKRLRIARQLLTDDGVIFISIDENEGHQLKLLCDELFGEQNMVGEFIWKARSGKGGTTSLISMGHEYILCYAKDRRKTNFYVEVRESKTKKTEQLRQWGQAVLREDRPTMFFPVLYKEDQWSLPLQEEIDQLYQDGEFDDAYLAELKEKYEGQDHLFVLPYIDGQYGRWRKGVKGMQELIDEGLLVLGKENTLRKIIPRGNITKTAVSSIIDSKGTASNGTVEIKNIFEGNKVFDTTKPLDLIEYLLFLATYNKEEAVVLDFFAGSGTTGQATMNLNNHHGGKRKYILCTNNEVADDVEIDLLVQNNLVGVPPKSKKAKKYKDWVQDLKEFKQTDAYTGFIRSDTYNGLGIARAVTYQRLSRVINGYETKDGESVSGSASNLHYYVTDFVDKRFLSFDNSELVERLDAYISLKEEVYSYSSMQGITVISSSDKDVFIYPNDFIAKEDAHIIAENMNDDKETVIYIQKENKVDKYINELDATIKFVPADFFKGGELRAY